MEQNGQVRKEPTMADLDAFEKLLRESLQAEPHRGQPAGSAPSGTAPVAAQAQSPAEPQVPQRSDLAAMAELAKLIDAPLEFAPPPPAPAANDDSHVHGRATASLAPAWTPEAKVEAHFSGAEPAQVPQQQFQPQPEPQPQPVVEDPLAAFEEELRRFDALRLEQSAPPELRGVYPAQGESTGEPRDAYGYQPSHTPPGQHAEQYSQGDAAATSRQGYFDETEMRPAQRIQPQFGYQPEARDTSPLAQAEDRIAAEAAAAAAGAAPAGGRSRGVFLTLAGLAVAGAAVIGSSFLFSSSKTGRSGSDVPVIAAKPQPTKEKPADAGGIEIPNQNKQVLAARNTPEAKPGQVVNNTEQPLDLNQATRRDQVRVIAPNPYQSPAAGAGASPGTADSAGSAPGPGGLVEPRRVTSIRLGEPSAPSVAPSPPSSAVIPGVPVGTSVPPAPRAAPPASPAVVSPPAVPQPPSAAPPARSEASPVVPPKVETRPTTPQPRGETPPARSETPKTAPPPKVAATAPAPKATPPRAANAPLPLSGEGAAPAAAAAAGAGGGYAIQLASRPTEADARAASTQLKSKFASTLGSRALSVVSGEANGQTVYRVRAGGYSQAAAVDACNKIKAAGGGCFVTKQ